MLTLPAELTRRYETLLTQQAVAGHHRPHYLKWLRYYWDFCHKYDLEPADPNSFPAFAAKLRARNQPDVQRQQAQHAISLYYEAVSTARGTPQGNRLRKVEGTTPAVFGPRLVLLSPAKRRRRRPQLGFALP